MSETNEDVIQYYAKKYDFHRILTLLLAADEKEQQELIAIHPITKSDAFIAYLRNKRLETKEVLENLPGSSDKQVQIIVERFDAVEKSILSGSRQHSKKPPDAPSSSAPGPLSYVQCSACAGTGHVACSSCSGYGYHTTTHTQTAWDGSTEYVEENIPCSSCSGGQQTCFKCGGSGKVLE